MRPMARSSSRTITSTCSVLPEGNRSGTAAGAPEATAAETASRKAKARRGRSEKPISSDRNTRGRPPRRTRTGSRSRADRERLPPHFAVPRHETDRQHASFQEPIAPASDEHQLLRILPERDDQTAAVP